MLKQIPLGVFCCFFFMLSSSVYAFNCNNYYSLDTVSQPFSIDHANSGQRCSVPIYSIERDSQINHKAVPSLQANNIPWKVDSSSYGDQFWLHWDDQFADSPVLMDHNSSTFYGLGFWMPTKYDDEDLTNAAGAEDWIFNHGLQMSLGFGDIKGHKPRVRFDYRWHNNSHVEDGVSMQVHIPLN
ncbi:MULTISPECIES: hypothetical protein [unclassified Photobacterium]|uniref:hypothetical protein n=1 Tax=unclassified Photobacterium TaxID=2628852 RepID=UPI001EDD2FA3|nr:hypothetical protein [Photobacterium sp. Ph6]MCG3876042.1 hypothetical protein [Photobacterium sp. Ph5]